MSNAVGLRLRALRTERQVSLTEVAQVLALKPKDIAEIERGDRYLSVYEMGVLYTAFQWHPRQLLGMPLADAQAPRAI
jgi:transcriptional regulator with XRE-family HTH domain